VTGDPGAATDGAGAGGPEAGPGAAATDPAAETGDMELFDLRVTVERIEGRSVCGLAVGDYFELVRSNELRIPDGKHFCVYALQSVLPLLPAKQRQLPEHDWLERDSLVCCPDPEERVVMRIERIGRRRMRSSDLT
jgi:uncharacterized repeat protein (TIGR04076 family)